MKSFYTVTLGCKVNAYESEALSERLLDKGYIVDDKNPDYIFINTCAVTSESERKDRQRIRSLIKEYKNSKIIVMGCSSQVHKEDYLSMEGVSLVIGTSKKNCVEDLSLNLRDQVDLNSRNFSYDDMLIKKGEHAERAYIKVQDGCDNFCTYCIVPFTRGKSRSRDYNSIIKECSNLLESGVKEIVIGGIDTGSYNYNNVDLTGLLKMILSLPYSDYRLRVSSIEASQISDEYIELFHSEKKLCPHFHIPLQSGSEKILKLMNRKYSLKDFQKKLDLIKEKILHPAFSTDVITGFPGETENDFLDTYNFLKDNMFMRIHAFSYSERKESAASHFKDSVPREIRLERVRRLISLSEENEKKYLESIKGEKVHILVEKQEGKVCSGYTENYLYLSAECLDQAVNTFIEKTIS